MNRRIENQRGQVAIFVAFVFQVLFVFFAMIVNVGLLVHHKINLQNSVDFAAYYGAMKQAETLNAIAHINYQIRQSYKLMMFRYRELGTAGDLENHPWLSQQRTFRPGNEVESALTYKPSYCISYTPFDFMGNTETYCKNAGGVNIPLPGRINLVSSNFLVSPILSFQNQVQQAFELATQKGIDACKRSSNIAYYSLARFVYGYKMDIATRKRTIIKLANDLSQANNDFKDIDGLSVRDGVKMVLEKNLTPQNKEGLKATDFRFLNSMGGGSCGAGGGEMSPPAWLQEVFVMPLYLVMEADCPNMSENVRIQFLPKFINSGRPTDRPSQANYDPVYANSIDQLLPYVQEPSSASALGALYRTSMGFEKNPWCMSYIAVEAETTPSLPFSPLGSVRLKARAFAKPFGGRIGPWHREKWSSGALYSDQGKEADPLLPERVLPTNTQPELAADRNRGNYSRFIGDTLGVNSKMFSGYMAKGIYGAVANQVLSLSWWDHLTEDGQGIEKLGSPGNTLAWDKRNNTAPGRMRELETMVVAPNQFEAAYYSIEPDFYRNYLVRLLKRENEFGFNILGDHGSIKTSGDKRLKEFSVKEQVKTLRESGLLDGGSVLTYFVREFGELLTSYQSLSPKQHILDESRFGQCSLPVPDEAPAERATPGNCIEGGRTGYAVKIVDGEFLKRTDLELGGPGVSGAIKNPWSEDFR